METRLTGQGKQPNLLISMVSFVLAALAPSAFSQEPIKGFSEANLPDANIISADLEGCRRENAEFSSGDWDCINPNDAFTDGNLGKLYNELDLVPHRLTLTSKSNIEETYQIVVGGDNMVEDGTGSKPLAIGYDKIGLFTDVSGGCEYSLYDDPEDGINQIGDFGIGGAIHQIVAVINVTHPPGETCVGYYAERLAITSSNLTGSSNRSFVVAGTGAQSIPIPDVKQSLSLGKEMSASQGAGFNWIVSKSATPGSVDFGDTCEAPAETPVTTDVTVSWEKGDPSPSGTVRVTTIFNLTNSTTRELEFKIQDTLSVVSTETSLNIADLAAFFNESESTFGGAGTSGINASCSLEPGEGPGGIIDVAVDKGTWNTAGNQPVFLPTVGTCTAVWDIPVEGDEPIYPDFSGGSLLNEATAKVFDSAFPDDESCICQLEATASAEVQLSGAAENESANVTDTEYLTEGTVNTIFSVTDVQGTTGIFEGGGTPTDIGPGNDVVWHSCNGDFCLEESGSVTFSKAVYFTSPLAVGSLDDVATLAGSEGFSDESELLQIPISSNPQVDLTISKTIEFPLYEGDQDAEFCFSVESDDYNLTDDPNDPLPLQSDGVWPCIAFTYGDGTTKSVTLSDIPPGTYEVTEIYKPDGWAPVSPMVTGYPTAETFETCSDTVSFTNNLTSEATAKAAKDTDPDGQEAGWEFTLSWVEDDTTQTEACYTGIDGTCTFTEEILPGVAYKIEETDTRIEAGGGWDDDESSGRCEFTPTVDDAIVGTEFACFWENIQRGKIVVEKTTIPLSENADFDFSDTSVVSFRDPDPGNFTLNAASNASYATDDNSIVPGSYSVREVDPSPNCTLNDNPCSEAWDLLIEGIGAVSCVDSDESGSSSAPSLSDPNEAIIELDPGETVTCTFTNQLRGTVTVNKTESGSSPAAGAWTFEVRQGASSSSSGTTLATDSNDASGVVDFVGPDANGPYFLPGDYQLCERGVGAGWDTTLAAGVVNVDWFTPPGELEQDAVCVDFPAADGDETSLLPGENEVFDVDNNPPPGGVARTIGFWRNWSGVCTKGNQEDTLRDNLGGIELGKISWPFKPVLGHDSDPSTCDAVNILSKRNLDGDVRAFDPAYALASQYLAYLLNVNAGAGTCGLETESATAQGLLSDANFNATDANASGSGKGKKKSGGVYVENKTKSLWVSLASLFDQYNNNELGCGAP